MKVKESFRAYLVCCVKLEKGRPVAGSDKVIAIFKELSDACEFADMKSKSASDQIDYNVFIYGRWPIQ